MATKISAGKTRGIGRMENITLELDVIPGSQTLRIMLPDHTYYVMYTSELVNAIEEEKSAAQ